MRKKQQPFNRVAVITFIIVLLAALLLVGTLSANGQSAEQLCIGASRSVSKPLIDLGNEVYTRMDGQKTSFTGGLYPNGSNQRPPEHEAAGVALASQIIPLDETGQPDPANGKIVMISVGMSNVSSEFWGFIELAHDQRQELNPQLVLVNGALGGRTADFWVDPQAQTWQLLDAQLAHNKVTPDQVQVAWVKQTLTNGGNFPEKAQKLQADLELIAQNLHQHFPNLKIAYFSSRTRSYLYWRGLSPEPVAFETGFAVKWMIEKQINGDPALNYDPAKGAVKAPYLSWGPYLWIDGQNPRLDGRVWLEEDLTADCTHPSPSGNTKVAEMLMEFFKTDSTSRSWFLRPGATVEVLPTSTLDPRAALITQPPTAQAKLLPSPTPLRATEARPTPAATAVAAVIPTVPQATPLPAGGATSSVSPAMLVIGGLLATVILFSFGFVAGRLVMRNR